MCLCLYVMWMFLYVKKEVVDSSLRQFVQGLAILDFFVDKYRIDFDNFNQIHRIINSFFHSHCVCVLTSHGIEQLYSEQFHLDYTLEKFMHICYILTQSLSLFWFRLFVQSVLRATTQDHRTFFFKSSGNTRPLIHTLTQLVLFGLTQWMSTKLRS